LPTTIIETEPVPTVAVTALLVARRSMPDVKVTTMLDTVFKEIDFVAAGSAAGTLISRSRAESGLQGFSGHGFSGHGIRYGSGRPVDRLS
jgi:TRAP-type uncharacterized transport system substrate-binding protein